MLGGRGALVRAGGGEEVEVGGREVGRSCAGDLEGAAVTGRLVTSSAPMLLLLSLQENKNK